MKFKATLVIVTHAEIQLRHTFEKPPFIFRFNPVTDPPILKFAVSYIG